MSSPAILKRSFTALAFFALAATSAAQAPTTYQAEFLGKAKHVAAMNESGLVVGTGAISIYPRAYVAGPGKPITYLPLPMGFLSSGARDINAAGVIVGVISPNSTTSFYPQPAKWEPNGLGGYSVTLLLTLPGDNRGTADAINNLGDIVGTSNYVASLHTVLYKSSGTIELLGLASLPAQSINDARVYVSGDSKVDLNTLQVTSLGVPAGYLSASALSINASGQIGGTLAPSGVPGCTEQPAVYTSGLGWQSVGSCGVANFVYDLNDQGDVLMTQAGVPYVAFAGGAPQRVEDLIVASSGHWTLDQVFNIALNGARQIAVPATNGGQTGIILLTPSQVCQADLGFAGPGAATLSMCGGDLSSGTNADLTLAHAPANTPAFFAVGSSYQPVPLFGGTLVAFPPLAVIGKTTNGLGEAGFQNFPGGGGPVTLYVQAVHFDASLPGSFGLSNALQVQLLP